MDKKIIIAIDGFSSCGKSTMARQLARELGYIYVDTGAMYRAVALYALRNGWAKDGEVDSEELDKHIGEVEISFELTGAGGSPEIYLCGEAVEQSIRTMEVASYASKVAALPSVRTALTLQQQRMGDSKGIVMDGRDIGTTVFPHADLKVFVTASPLVRAQRRHRELGEGIALEEVLHQIEERDYADMHREVSPLRQAPDAVVLDNSDLTREEQLQRLLSLAHRAIEG